MTDLTVLAIDLGAESGRVMAVHFDGEHLHMEALHRFPNTPATVRGALYWDFLRLWNDVLAGVEKGKAYAPASLGVDTWGVDFGLLDNHGELLGNVVHYRDTRTEGMMDRVFSRVPRRDVFMQTGIQFLPFNTLYQLMSLAEREAPSLRLADTFLTAPDLLNYWLTGEKVCEFTNATTTQLYNPRIEGWATELIDGLGIPQRIFPELVEPGTRLGTFEGIPVIAPACHDTGSAVAAVPARIPDYAYISSGTWSLVGLEVKEPVINEAALAANVTNEGGVFGTYRLLRNVMGLWIVQQCRATWEAEGHSFSYTDLVRLAEQAPAFTALIDPDDTRFLSPGDHPTVVRELCSESGHSVPEDRGAIVRCVLESLALAYRRTLDTLQSLTGKSLDVIHMVGGGIQNELLCQMTADATRTSVQTGPVEATVLGNALMQLITLGEIDDLEQGRQLVANLPGGKTFEPRNVAEWEEAYQRFEDLYPIDVRA